MDYLIIHGNLFELYYPSLIRSIRESGFPDLDVIDPWEINLTMHFRSDPPRVVQLEPSRHSLALAAQLKTIKADAHYFLWLRTENADLEGRAMAGGLGIARGDEQSLLAYIRAIPRK